jgi:hypothetical protein
MSFPASPQNGQQVSVNNITYSYNSTNNTWTRVTGVGSVYDLDDITNYVDGFRNSFGPTYNQTRVAIASPWNLMVTVNGLVQPAFQANAEVVWQSQVLTSNKGYTIDQATGNIKFADSVPAGSQVMARTVIGNANTTTKKYPFTPLDILMGY